MRYDAHDLFAGAGGWSVALRDLGGRSLGVELDAACRATRKAAGFHTVQGDVLDYSPRVLPPAPGLIGSPPCQTFSKAGKGSGRRNLDDVLLAVKSTAARQAVAATWSDPRTGLVVEPLRWALDALDNDMPYEWVALEQVPTVLPVWEAIAEALAIEGYHVATGVARAEQYGVPQTRSRAVLLAHRDRPVSLPKPTHSRYHSRDKTRLDPGVLPWVSMAEALGWTEDEVVGFPRRADTQSNKAAEVVTLDGVDYRGRDLRPTTEPSMVATEKARSWRRWMVQSKMARATVRHAGEPAPTITAGHDSGDRHWAFDRPATTIVGSFRPDIVAAPGYRVSAEDGSRQNAPGSVPVNQQEAAVLQSFPFDYPWQGSRTKQFQQIGNAIPPVLAGALLSEVWR